MDKPCQANTKSPFGKFDAMCGHWDDIDADGGWCRDRAAERRDLLLLSDGMYLGEDADAFWKGVHDLEESHVRPCAWAGRDRWRDSSALPKWLMACERPMGTDLEPCRSWPTSLRQVVMVGLSSEEIARIFHHERMHALHGCWPLGGLRREVRKIIDWAEDAQSVNGYGPAWAAWSNAAVDLTINQSIRGK